MLAMLAVTLFTMSSAAQPASTASALAPAAPPAHVVLIVMENHEYPAVISSSAAPYVNQLAGRSVLLTHHHAVSHPSLPKLPGAHRRLHVRHHERLHHVLDPRHESGRPARPARPDLEGLHGGNAASLLQGRVQRRLCKEARPFHVLRRHPKQPRRCREVVPFSQLGPDLSGSRLPRFAWITPNLCHDMHDCSVRTGDRWLAQWVPRILPALGSDGLLILTWDEGATDSACCSVARGGHVATIVAGPGARRGVKASSRTDHYSILRLVQDLFHLAHLRKAGQAPEITAYRR